MKPIDVRITKAREYGYQDGYLTAVRDTHGLWAETVQRLWPKSYRKIYNEVQIEIRRRIYAGQLDLMDIVDNTILRSDDKVKIEINGQFISLVKDEGSLAFIKIVEPKALHGIGIELHNKSVADLNAMKGHIADLIWLYTKMDKFDHIAYQGIICAYAPIIDKRLKWEDIERFMNYRQEDAWV